MGWGLDDDRPDDARTSREAENGLRQARLVADLIREGLAAPVAFRLEPATICELNRVAVAGLIPTAGRLRERSDLEISGSRHVVPPHGDVPALIDEACAFVEERWNDDPVYLAA